MSIKRNSFMTKSIFRDVPIALTFTATLMYLFNSKDMIKQSLEYIGVALVFFIFITYGMFVHIKNSNLMRKGLTPIGCRLVIYISFIIVLVLLALILYLFITKQLSIAGILFLLLYPHVGLIIVMHYVKNNILNKDD